MRVYFWCARLKGGTERRGDIELSELLSVLHVISAPASGGAEIYVKDLAIELKREGHQPAIAFIAHASDYGRSSEFEIQYLTELERAQIDYFFVGNASRKNPALGALRILRYCGSRGVQIYHSHLTLGIIFGAFLHIPRLHTHHNSLMRLPRWAYKLLNALIEQYVGISDVCADHVRRFTGRDVALVRNGVEVAKFEPHVRQALPGLLVNSICVGRVVAQKNYELLVNAVALLPPEIRGRLRVSIAGEGPPRSIDHLRKVIMRNDLTNEVKLLGNRLDVSELLDRSDMFLMSSAWEGLPISLLEATASGLPFIATDVGGCREVAELCGNGVIVPPNDPEALSNALAELVDDESRRTSLSEAAVRNAYKLSIEEAVKQHLRLYSRLNSAHKSARRTVS